MLTKHSSKIKAFSIFEILISVSLSSILILPSLSLLLSLYSGLIDADTMDIHFPDKQWSKLPLSKNTSLSFFKNGKVVKGTNNIQSIDQSSCQIVDSIITGVTFGSSGVLQRDISFDQLGLVASSTIRSINVIGQNLIVSTDSASTTVDDLYVYHIDKNALDVYLSEGYGEDIFSLISSFNTGPGFIDGKVYGEYFYGANTSVNSQGQVVHMDISNTSSALSTTPVSSGGLDFFGPVNNFTISGSGSTNSPISKRVIVYKDLLIVGTQKTSVDEITIFDRVNGIIISSINTDYGINELYVIDDFLIVLGPQDPEIDIFDIKDPYSPSLVGYYDMEGGSGNGRSISVLGDILSIGRSVGGEEYHLFGLVVDSVRSSSSAMEHLDHISETPQVVMHKKMSKKVGSSIDRIISGYLGDLLFTSNQAGRVSAMYMSEDKLHLKNMSPDMDLPGRATDFVCVGDYIFVSVNNIDYPLRIFQIKK
jgi:hypothetical protein